MLQKLTGLKASISTYQSLVSQQEDLQTLWELANEEQDEDLEPEIEQASHALQKELEKLEIQVLFSGPYDDHDCILTLHAGAGGTEAQDWTDMLYRMYSRFCEKNGFKCEVMDFLDGEEAGLKSITLAIEGPHAYGHFRAERGVHRLVRISPFDASATPPLLQRMLCRRCRRITRWKSTRMTLKLTPTAAAALVVSTSTKRIPQ